ncbi:unnamed protein product, partial [Vitis vinifera]|uniref:Uncharacterized protein n=1 Tax=Vitis vinifera TaxID=29760 RepID=D7TDG1_VITVI
MSLPQQQPPVIYPNTVTRQPPSHSNGSFGTVFIVLGVIVVISAIACVLGRLCNRRRHHHPNPKQNSAFRPKEPDLEFVIFQNYPFCSFLFSLSYPPSTSLSLPSETD